MAGAASRFRLILRQPGFAGLLGASFSIGFGYSFVGPYLSLWGTKELGLRQSSFGWYMTVTSLCAVMVATTLARWSDTHLPRKLMLLLGGAGGALGYAAYAIFHDVRVLLAVGCSVLALSALCFSQVFAYARERYYQAEVANVPHGFLLSVVRVCFSLAWTTGPSVSAWMMIRYGFHGIFLGAASLYCVFVVLIARFVPWEPRSEQIRTEIREPVWRILTRPDLLAMFVAFALIYAAHTMNALNLPLMLTDVLGASPRVVGITFGIGPLVELPLMLWFGHLAARGHSLGLLRFGAIETCAYFLLLNRVQAPWNVFLLQSLHGTSFAIISNVGIMFFQDLVPGQPGLATTVYANAANIGNLLGYFGFGSLVLPMGNRGLFLAEAALTFGTVLIFALYRSRAIVPAVEHDSSPGVTRAVTPPNEE